MKKFIYLILSISFVLLLSNNVFAANWNCEIVATESKYQEIAKNISADFSNIMPQEAIEKALDNLKIYCDKTNKNWSSTDKTSFIWPESKILFDHLLDVYLRRLDAKIAFDNHKWDLLYWLEPDSLGLERRTYIINIGDSVDNELPIQIENEYKKYWTLSSESKYNLPDRTSTEAYNVSQEVLSKYNADYVDMPLINRYYNACEITMLIYFKLGGSNNVNLSTFQKLDIKNGYNICEELEKSRVQQENNYVQNVIQMKWMKTLSNDMKSYLSDYFVQNRMVNLQLTIKNLDNAFFSTYRWVPRLINQCM